MTLPTPDKFEIDSVTALSPYEIIVVIKNIQKRHAQIIARLEELRKRWCDYKIKCNTALEARENYCTSCCRMFSIIEELRGTK